MNLYITGVASNETRSQEFKKTMWSLMVRPIATYPQQEDVTMLGIHLKLHEK